MESSDANVSANASAAPAAPEAAPAPATSKPRGNPIEAIFRLISMLGATPINEIGDPFSGEIPLKNKEASTTEVEDCECDCAAAPAAAGATSSTAVDPELAKKVSFPSECWCGQCPKNENGDEKESSESQLSYSIMDGSGKVSTGNTKSLDEVLQMFFRQILPSGPRRSWWDVTNDVTDPAEYTVRVVSKFAEMNDDDASGSLKIAMPFSSECKVDRLLGTPTVSGGEIVWSGSNLVDLMHALRTTSGVPRSLRKIAQQFFHLPVLGKTQFRLTHPKAIAPQRKNFTDSGFDLHLVELLKSEGGVDFYTTGVVLEPPPMVWHMLVGRSSLAKSGYALANGVGIIDASYRGEVIVALRKMNPDAPAIELPARLVQVVPQKWHDTDMVEAKSVSNTERGASGGLGSAQFKTESAEAPQCSEQCPAASTEAPQCSGDCDNFTSQ